MRKELPKGLIVSCQAGEGEPLYGLGVMPLFARCAVAGGAVAIRALAAEIPAIRREVSVPVIGLVKRDYPDSEVYITPTLAEVDAVLATGCEVLATDATARRRPGGLSIEELVTYVRNKSPETALMADIDSEENAFRADELGFDYISTTLRSFTRETENAAIPDCAFVRRLKTRCRASVIVEGGIWEREQLAEVAACAPYAVVIGTAITRPADITRRFSETLRLAR